MRKDDTKFLLALIVTLFLAALVILGEHKRELITGQGEPVDMELIQQMVDEGKLSLHPADFYKTAGEE